MARRINRSVADAFSAALDETEEWQEELNLRELVESSFFSIEKARDRKATWEQIADVLQKTIGDTVDIKADTIRQYYFEALKNRDELAKERRRKSSKKKRTSANTAEHLNTSKQPKRTNGQRLPGNLKSESDSRASRLSETRDLPSSFNLRPR